jgi:hypothetical protein
MLPDRRPYVQFAFIVVAIGAFIIAMAQVALLAWRMIDGFFGSFS